MADALTLDPSIAAAADLAAVMRDTDAAFAKLVAVWVFADPQWLASLAMVAAGTGRTLAQAFAGQLPRVWSGYMPAAQRRSARAGMHRLGCTRRPIGGVR